MLGHGLCQVLASVLTAAMFFEPLAGTSVCWACKIIGAQVQETGQARKQETAKHARGKARDSDRRALHWRRCIACVFGPQPF